MASPAELRDLLAENSRTMVADAAATQGAIRAMTGAVRALATNGGAVPGAAPPVLTPRSALQTVRKSSETIVQLSLSDDQYTVAEFGVAPMGVAPPTDGITHINMMGETSPAETETKVEALLEFHRKRGLKLRSAQRILPDGAWVNPNPENVDDYRLPAPPLRSLIHSELNKREQSAVSALSSDSGINVGVSLTIWMSLKRLSLQLSRRRFSNILAMSVISARVMPFTILYCITELLAGTQSQMQTEATHLDCSSRTDHVERLDNLTQRRFRLRRTFTDGTTMLVIHLFMLNSMTPHIVSATLKM